jgi:hypothetical protein
MSSGKPSYSVALLIDDQPSSGKSCFHVMIKADGICRHVVGGRPDIAICREFVGPAPLFLAITKYCLQYKAILCVTCRTSSS